MDNIQTLWGHRQPALMVDNCVGCLWFKISKKYDFNSVEKFLISMKSKRSGYWQQHSCSLFPHYCRKFTVTVGYFLLNFERKTNDALIKQIYQKKSLCFMMPWNISIIFDWNSNICGDDNVKEIQCEIGRPWPKYESIAVSQQQLFSPIIVLLRVRKDFSRGSEAYFWTWLTQQIVEASEAQGPLNWKVRP